MAFEGLQRVLDPTVGAWLAAAMHGFGGHVHHVVPVCFEAYARVLHPPTDTEGRPTTWSAVCAATGATPHALMQWWAISGDYVPAGYGQRNPGRWPGQEPFVGSLDPTPLRRLLDVVSTSAPTSVHQCYHAVWDGFGWLPPEDPGPFLEHPNRRYLLHSGPAVAALTIGNQRHIDDLYPQSPNLLWPAHHSWCVATEIDFDSTLVAGSRALVDAILADPELESWEVAPDDDLTAAGDLLNSSRT